MKIVPLFVWITTWTQVCLAAQIGSITQSHVISQEFGSSRSFTNAAGMASLDGNIGLTSNRPASSELQRLIEQYLMQSSAALQEIAILSNVERQAAIPVGIKELLEYKSLYTTEAALLGYIDLYGKRPSPTLLFNIAELRLLYPNISIPGAIMNDLKVWDLLSSEDQQMHTLSMNMSNYFQTESVAESASTILSIDYSRRMSELCNNYLSFQSDSTLNEIADLTSLHPELNVPPVIMQALKFRNNLADPYSLVSILIDDYNESPRLSKLQEIREVTSLYPEIELPADISSQLSVLPSYYQMTINELIREYEVTSSRDILLKISSLALSSSDIVLPAYIIEKISLLNSPNYTYNEKLLQYLINIYEESRSTAVLQEIAAFARDDSSLALSAAIISEISKVSLTSPSQYYFEELLHEYYTSKSVEILQVIGELLDFDSRLVVSATLEQESESSYAVSRLDYSIAQYSMHKSQDVIFSNLIREYELTKSRPTLYRIISIARSNPYLDLEQSVAFDVFSCFNRTEGSTVGYLQELTGMYISTKSVEILQRIELLCRFYPCPDMNSDIKRDLLAMQPRGKESSPEGTRSIPSTPSNNLVPITRASYPSKDILVKFLIEEYEKTNSETILIVILEIVRSQPSINLPMSIGNFLLYGNGKISEVQRNVDILVTQYLISFSIDTLFEITIILNSHPEIQIPSSVYEAIVKRSTTLATAQQQLEILISKYYVTRETSIILIILETLRAYPSLRIPVYVALDIIEIFSAQSLTISQQSMLMLLISQYEQSASFEILLKIKEIVIHNTELVVPSHIAQALAEIKLGDIILTSETSIDTNNSPAFLLQQLIVEYTHHETIENLVKILEFTRKYPYLRVSSFIAMRIATISHLSIQELRLMILIEQYLALPSPIALLEIAELHELLPNFPLPRSIALLLHISTTSFFEDQILLEFYIQEYFRAPSFIKLNIIAEFLAKKPHLPVPSYIARLLAGREEWISNSEVLMQKLILQYLTLPSHALLVDIVELASMYPCILVTCETNAGAVLEGEQQRSAISSSVVPYKRSLGSLITDYHSIPTDSLLFLILELLKIYPNYPVPDFILFQQLMQNYVLTGEVELLKRIVIMIPIFMETYVPEAIVAALLEIGYLPSQNLNGFELLQYLISGYYYSKSDTIQFAIRALSQSVEDRQLIESIYEDVLPLINDIETPQQDTSSTRSNAPIQSGPQNEVSEIIGTTTTSKDLIEKLKVTLPALQETLKSQIITSNERIAELSDFVISLTSGDTQTSQLSVTTATEKLVLIQETDIMVSANSVISDSSAIEVVMLLRIVITIVKNTILEIEVYLLSYQGFIANAATKYSVSQLETNSFIQNIEFAESALKLCASTLSAVAVHSTQEGFNIAYSRTLLRSLLDTYVAFPVVTYERKEEIIGILSINNEEKQVRFLSAVMSRQQAILEEHVKLVERKLVVLKDIFRMEVTQLRLSVSSENLEILVELNQLLSLITILSKEAGARAIESKKILVIAQLMNYQIHHVELNVFLENLNVASLSLGKATSIMALYSNVKDNNEVTYATIGTVFTDILATFTDQKIIELVYESLFSEQLALEQLDVYASQESSLMINSAKVLAMNFRTDVASRQELFVEHVISNREMLSQLQRLIYVIVGNNFNSQQTYNVKSLSTTASCNSIPVLLQGIVAIIERFVTEAEKIQIENAEFVSSISSQSFSIGAIDKKLIIHNINNAEEKLQISARAMTSVTNAAKTRTINIVILRSVLYTLLEFDSPIPVSEYDLKKYLVILSSEKEESRRTILSVVVPAEHEVFEKNVEIQIRRTKILQLFFTSVSQQSGFSFRHLLEVDSSASVERLLSLISTLTNEAERYSIENRKLLDMARSSGFGIADSDLNVIIDNVNLGGACLLKASGAMSALMDSYFDDGLSPESMSDIFNDIVQSIKDTKLIESIHDDLFSLIGETESFAKDEWVAKELASILRVILPYRFDVLTKNIDTNNQRVSQLYMVLNEQLGSGVAHIYDRSIPNDKSNGDAIIVVQGILATVNQLTTYIDNIRQTTQAFMQYAESQDFYISHSETKPFIRNTILADVAIGRCVGITDTIIKASESGMVAIALQRAALAELMDVSVLFPLIDYDLLDFSTSSQNISFPDLQSSAIDLGSSFDNVNKLAQMTIVTDRAIVASILPARQADLERYISMNSQNVRLLTLVIEGISSNSADQTLSVELDVGMLLERTLTLINVLLAEASTRSQTNRQIMAISSSENVDFSREQLILLQENIRIAASALGRISGATESIVAAYSSEKLNFSVLNEIISYLVEFMKNTYAIDAVYDAILLTFSDQDLLISEIDTTSNVSEFLQKYDFTTLISIVLPTRQAILEKRTVAVKERLILLERLLESTLLHSFENDIESVNTLKTLVESAILLTKSYVLEAVSKTSSNKDYIYNFESKNYKITKEELSVFSKNIEVASLAVGKCEGAIETLSLMSNEGFINFEEIINLLKILMQLTDTQIMIGEIFDSIQPLIDLEQYKRRDLLEALLPEIQKTAYSFDMRQQKSLQSLLIILDTLPTGVVGTSSFAGLAWTIETIRDVVISLAYEVKSSLVASDALYAQISERSFDATESELLSYWENIKSAGLCLSRLEAAIEALAASSKLEVITSVDYRELLNTLLLIDNLAESFESLYDEISTETFSTAQFTFVFLAHQEALERQLSLHLQRIDTFRSFITSLIVQLDQAPKSIHYDTSYLLDGLLTLVISLTNEAERSSRANADIIARTIKVGQIITETDIVAYNENSIIAAKALGRGVAAINALIDAYTENELSVATVGAIIAELLKALEGQRLIDVVYDSLLSLADRFEQYDFIAANEFIIQEEVSSLFTVMLPLRQEILKREAISSKNEVEQLNALLNQLQGKSFSVSSELEQFSESGDLQLNQIAAMETLMAGLIQMIEKLNNDVQYMVVENDKLIENAISKNFVLKVVDLRPFFNNIKMASEAIGRSSGASLAIINAAKVGTLNIGLLKAVFESLLQLTIPHLEFGEEFNELLTAFAAEDNENRRNILMILLQSKFSVLEKYVVSNRERVNCLISFIPNFIILIRQSAGPAYEAMTIVLEEISSLLLSLTARSEELLNSNRAIISKAIVNHYFIEESELQIFTSNTIEAWAALGATTASTIALGQLYTSDKFSIVAMAHVAAALFERAASADVIESMYDIISPITIASGVSIERSAGDVSTNLERSAEAELITALQPIILTWQTILEKQSVISANRLEEVENLVKILSLEANSNGTLRSLEFFADILSTLINLIETLNTQAVSAMTKNRIFIENSAKESIVLESSEVATFMSNAKAASTDLGRAAGLSKALIVAAGSGSLNLGAVANLLRKLFETFSYAEDIQFLNEELDSILSIDNSFERSLVLAIMPGWQETLEKYVVMINAQVRTLELLVASIVFELHDENLGTSKTLSELLLAAIGLIKNMAEEMNIRSVQNKKILEVVMASSFDTTEADVLIYIKNTRFSFETLGRIEGAVLALIQSYTSGSLAVRSVAGILSQLALAIRFHPEIDESYDFFVPLITSDYLNGNTIIKEVSDVEIEVLHEKLSLTASRFTFFEILVTNLLEQVETINGISALELKSVLTGVVSLTRYYTTHVSETSSNIKRNLYQSGDTYSKEMLLEVAKSYRDCFIELGRAEGAIAAVVVAINAGEFNSAMLWSIMREIVQNDASVVAIEILFDDLNSLLLIDDIIMKRIILSVILPKRILLLEETILVFDEDLSRIELISQKVFTQGLLSNTTVAHNLLFEFEASIILMTQLVSKVKEILIFQKDSISRASDLGFDISTDDLTIFVDKDKLAFRILAEASGVCAAIEFHEIGSVYTVTALKELETLVIAEGLLYELNVIIAQEAVLRELVVLYSTSHTFSYLKEISLLITTENVELLPEDVVLEIKRLGLYPGEVVTEEQNLLQLIEEYLETPIPDYLIQIRILLKKYPETKIPIIIFEQLISEGIVVESETFLSELIIYYTTHSTFQIAHLIEQMIEIYPNYQLSITVIEQLLMQGVTSEVILVQLINEYRISNSVHVLELIALVHYEFHPEYMISIDILEAFLSHGILVRTECFYTFLLHLQQSEMDTRALKFVGELIDTFPNIAVPAYLIRELITQEVVTRTIFLQIIELYKTEASEELLQIIADLHPQFSDVILPEYILQLILQLKALQIVKTRESYLLQLVQTYEEHFSVELLEEICELSKTLPHVALPSTVSEQIELYEAIAQANTTKVSETKLFSLIISTSAKYSNIPIPFHLQQELLYYQLIVRFEETFSLEILFEIAELMSSFPNVPLPIAVEQQIYLLQLIKAVAGGEVSIINLQKIAELSLRYPLIPIPEEVSEMIRLLKLIEIVVQSSTPLLTDIQEIAVLSVRFPSIAIPANIQQVILLITLIDEVTTSEFFSQLTLRQIASLSKQFPYVTIPITIQEQILLIQLIELIVSGASLEITVIQKVRELSLKYTFIILPDVVSQLMLLLELVEEAGTVTEVSYSVLFQISILIHSFPNFPLPTNVREQLMLLQLIEEVIGSEIISLATLRMASVLSTAYPLITIPQSLSNQILLIQLLEEYSSRRSLETVVRICELSKTVRGIEIGSQIIDQCRLLSLIDEVEDVSRVSITVLREVATLSYTYSYIPLPEAIQQQLALLLAIETASQQNVVSITLLQEIAQLSPLYPHIDVPVHILEQITLIRLIRECEQSPTLLVEALKEISVVYVKHPGVPIPKSIQNELLFVEILEQFNAATVNNEMAQKFLFLSESSTKIILPSQIQSVVHLIKLIELAVTNDSSDVLLLLEILELSEQFPSIMIPSIILLKLRLIKLCQTLEQSSVYLPEAIEEVIELSSVYQSIPISKYVLQLIEMVTLIKKVFLNIEVTTQEVFIRIEALSQLYPFVPIPTPVARRIRLTILIALLKTHSSVSIEVLSEVKELSESISEIALPAEITEEVQLCEYINLEETNVEVLRQIKSLSQKFSFIIIPERTRQQLLFIKYIDIISESSVISFEVLEELFILHEKFPSVALSSKLLRQITLVQLCHEAMTSISVSFTILTEIEIILTEFTQVIIIPEIVQRQLLLIKLLRQVEISQSPELVLLEISNLLSLVSNVNIPIHVSEQLSMIQIIGIALESPTADLIQQISIFSQSYPLINIPEVIQAEIHLQQFIDVFLAYVTPDEQILQEIYNYHQIVPNYPIPEDVFQQMILQQLLLEVEMSIAVSETVASHLLDSIDELLEIFPLYPVSPPVLELLISRREIKQLLIYIELAQVSATTEILQSIEELSRLHPEVPIPEDIHVLILQHIQKMYLQQLIEEVLLAATPSKSILDEIELLSQTTIGVEIPEAVTALIKRYKLERLLEKLIIEAQSTPAPSITLLEKIFEISQALPGIILPSSLEQQLVLLQLLKDTSPNIETLLKIKELSSAFPAISIPISIQQQLILLQLIQEALLSTTPSYAVLEQIAHSAESFPNIILPEKIQQQIIAMKMTVRLEQLIKVIEQSSYPSALVLKEISELSKIVKNVIVPQAILLQIRLQELIVDVQEGRTLIESLKEIATILTSIPNAPIPQSIRQQLILVQLIEEAQRIPSIAISKLKQISQLSASFPEIPVPESVRLLIEKSMSAQESVSSSPEPVNAIFTQLNQLVTMYDRIPSPLILRQIAQILPSAPNYPLPEKITRALVQLGLLSAEAMPSKKLENLIEEYLAESSESTLSQIAQIILLVPNAVLPQQIQRALYVSQINAAFDELNFQNSLPSEIMLAADSIDGSIISQRSFALSTLIEATNGYFDQARNTLYSLRDSVRASGHPMHRTTLSTFSNVLNQVSVLISQAREISEYVQQYSEGNSFSASTLAEISAKIRLAHDLLGKSEGARVALLLEATKFSHFIKLSNDRLLGSAANMKQDIDKVIFNLQSLTTGMTR